MSSESGPVVGIDLGTTFSVISHLDAQGRPVTIANSDGDLTTASVVFLDKAGYVIGKEAVKAAEFEPDRVAPYPKRDMGSELYHREVRAAYYRPEVLQAMILRKLKQDAEVRLGPLSKCVITVPAYFNEPRRKATQDAGRMAGWDVLDIINEPTAAAIAYGVHRGFLSPTAADAPPETILVYDLGGGTFDVTLMRVEKNCFTTLATAGDVELGGIDWDDRIVDLIAERFQSGHGVDPRTDPAALFRLKREAEDAKRSLTTKQETHVAFAHDGQRLRTTITRDEFEARTGDLVDRTIMTIRKLLREAKLTYMEVSRLLVVGGSSRMPMIRTALEKETGFTIDHPLSVDEAVTHGAALYAKYLQEKEAGGGAAFTVRNVNSHTLGVLGIEPSTMMRRRKVMIARNTPLPTQHTQRFVTAAAGQKSVVVTVIEGGDDAGNHSTLIGRCVLDGLAPNLPPRSQVDVTFVYSDNGRLEVRAFMPAVQRDSTLTIERAKGMSPELIQNWAECIAAGVADDCTLPETKKPADGESKPAAAVPATVNPVHAPDVRRMPKQVDIVEIAAGGEQDKTVALDEIASAALKETLTKEEPAEVIAVETDEKTTGEVAEVVAIGDPVPDVGSDFGAFSVDPNKKRKKKKVSDAPTGSAPAKPAAAAKPAPPAASDATAKPDAPADKKKKPAWKFW
jgi:molecular chaperone DnaK